MCVETDLDVKAAPHDELDLGTARPLGHFVPAIRSLALVSESRGCLGYFDDREGALPWLRMRARDGLRGVVPFDFRLYRFDRASRVWLEELAAVEITGIVPNASR